MPPKTPGQGRFKWSLDGERIILMTLLDACTFNPDAAWYQQVADNLGGETTIQRVTDPADLEGFEYTPLEEEKKGKEKPRGPGRRHDKIFA